jgi:hypothetical protein
MKRLVALIALIAWTCLGSVVGAQEREIKITRWYPSPVPGEVDRLTVEGLDPTKPASESEDQLRIDIHQKGVTRSARILNVTALEGPNRDGVVRPFQSILFTVPSGLAEGMSFLVLSYRGRQSGNYGLLIASRPHAPKILKGTAGAMAGQTIEIRVQSHVNATLNLRLERGKDIDVLMTPLIDPDVQGSEIFVMFKQASSTWTAPARVVNNAAAYQTGAAANRPSAPGYGARISVPADLAPGPAEMEVRVRANGVTSDPTVETVTIVDPDNPDNS